MFEGRGDANDEEEEEDNVDICLVEDEEDMLGTFVVPVADYMRAYFNYQILLKGDSFNIPRNAGHLQVTALCVGNIFRTLLSCV